MTTYIAGPMSGYPDFNYPAFHAAASSLRAAGVDVASPAEHGHGTNEHWTFYMRAGLRQLLDCDAIYMLTGWQESPGACLEHAVAQALGMRLLYADEHCTAHGIARCTICLPVTPQQPTQPQSGRSSS